MVHHIVVAVVDAPAVGSLPQGLVGALHGVLHAENGGDPAVPLGPAGLGAGDVDLLRVKGAILLRLAAVQAAESRPLRGPRRLEQLCAAEAGDGLAPLPQQPGEDVHIVAGLLEDHGAALPGIAPVAPDEGVGLVPVAHVLVGADAHHVPDAAAGDQFFQLIVEGGVPQHMADNDPARALLLHLQDLPALVQVRRDGLLHQDVVALPQGGDGVAHVLPVHGGHHHDVRQPGLGEHVLHAGKAMVCGDIVKPAGFFHFGRVQVGHSYYFHLIGEQVLHGGIGAAPVAESGDGKGNRWVHRVTSSLIWNNQIIGDLWRM